MDRVFIIAEAGVNHNGSLDMALRLIDAAADAGADAVKFQTFRAEKLVSPGAAKAEYQKAATGSAESQLAMIRRLELDRDAHERLFAHCRERGVLFTSTPFDEDSIRLLADLGMPFFKIPSGELTNHTYIYSSRPRGCLYICPQEWPIWEKSKPRSPCLRRPGLRATGRRFLHCTTEYPTPYSEVNLQAMQTLRAAFPGVAGVGLLRSYSRHRNPSGRGGHGRDGHRKAFHA